MSWTLRKKILLGYGIALLLLTLVFAWAFANLLRLGDASEEILSENYRSIRAADHMTSALERQDSGVLLYLLGFEEEGMEQFRANRAEFQRWFARAEDNVTIDDERAILARIDSAYAIYLTRFMELVRGDAPPDAAYRSVMLPAFRAVREASADLRAVNRRTMIAASNRTEIVAERATWSMGLVGAVALGAGLFFSLVLSNRLVRPLRDLQEATRRIAEGHYGVEVQARSSDELGALARQFNGMTAQLRAYRALNIEKIMAEHRKSEAILEGIDDGLVVVGADLHVEMLNPAAERALGVRREEARGRPFQDVMSGDRLSECVRGAVASGRPPDLEGEENFYSAERGGEHLHYQFTVTPVYGPQDDMLGVILLLRDVTKLKELDRLKSEFVATASHELKTPLTSIGMGIALLEESPESQISDDDQELLAVAREDVQRLRALVHDLLDLSKIESGRIDLELGTVPVGLLFDKALQPLRAQAEEQGIALESKLPEELPPVLADANKATWILTNLIANALRYAEAGGHVRLSAAPAGSKVHLSVADDGAGIPYEYQPRIFDKFVQVDGEGTSEGSGLGLAICREIVHAHGGSIWVESTPGEGSTFTFSLGSAG